MRRIGLQEMSEVALVQGEAVGDTIKRRVSFLMRDLEVQKGSLGIPEIQGEVNPRAGGIPQEVSRPVVGIVAEKLYPGAIGPIGVLKAFFATQLDFELP